MLQLPVEVATLLLNEKRSAINTIEEKSGNSIVIIPNRYYEIPKYLIDKSAQKSGKVSYTAVEPPSEEMANGNEDEVKEKLVPAVKSLIPTKGNSKKNKSLFGFFKNLMGSDEEDRQIQTLGDKQTEDVSKDNEQSSDNSSHKRSNHYTNRKPGRNRNRRQNVNKDSYQKRELSNNVNNAISEKEKPVLASKELANKQNAENKAIEKVKNKTNDKAVEKIAEVKSEKTELKKKPTRKKIPAPKVDLEKAGLKLVETKKSDKEVQEKKASKPKPRKKADWQKDKVEAKTTGKLEMIETKKKTTSKPKKTAKKG